jgi:hypothetical protein
MGKQLYRTQVLYNIIVSRRYDTHFKISYSGVQNRNYVYYIHVTDDDQVVRCYIGLSPIEFFPNEQYYCARAQEKTAMPLTTMGRPSSPLKQKEIAARSTKSDVGPAQTPIKQTFASFSSPRGLICRDTGPAHQVVTGSGKKRLGGKNLLFPAQAASNPGKPTAPPRGKARDYLEDEKSPPQQQAMASSSDDDCFYDDEPYVSDSCPPYSWSLPTAVVPVAPDPPGPTP